MCVYCTLNIVCVRLVGLGRRHASGKDHHYHFIVHLVKIITLTCLIAFQYFSGLHSSLKLQFGEHGVAVVATESCSIEERVKQYLASFRVKVHCWFSLAWGVVVASHLNNEPALLSARLGNVM